jgi:ABC-type amino acid transport substrate-binding protein
MTREKFWAIGRQSRGGAFKMQDTEKVLGNLMNRARIALAAAFMAALMAAAPSNAAPLKAAEGAPAPRELVVGLPASHALFSAYSGVYGRHEGFAVRAVQAVCAELGARCRFAYASYRDLEYMVASGRADFAAGFFASGGLYGATFPTTSYLVRAHPAVVSLNSNIAFASVGELSGLNYGVRFGTAELAGLDRARAVGRVAYYTVYGSYDEMFEALFDGRVDALYVDNLTAFGMMSEAGCDCYLARDKLGILPAGSTDGFVLGTSRGPEMASALERAVSKLRRNGTFNSIALNYFPFQAGGL